MAKFIKSIFHTSDRKKAQHQEDQEEERTENAAVGARRQLSISRSGRMRQANKKRHSLAMGVYGDTIQFESSQKPTTMEYHVNNPVCQTAPAILAGSGNRLQNLPTTDETIDDLHTNVSLKMTINAHEFETTKSPEEEIDSAFEIIDKS